MNDIGPEVSCSPEDATVSCVAKDYLCIVDRMNCSLQKIKSELVSYILDLKRELFNFIIVLISFLSVYKLQCALTCTCLLLFGYLEGPSDSVTKSVKTLFYQSLIRSFEVRLK